MACPPGSKFAKAGLLGACAALWLFATQGVWPARAANLPEPVAQPSSSRFT